MLTTQKPMKSKPDNQSPKGFALIVTLSLMILLTVIAVGLLSLSSISLRSTGQTSAMANARANARMALMLAIGELQKNAGPDQRITARADVLDEKITNPHLTGVWKSWQIKASEPPTASEYEKAARDAKFAGWLASSPDATSATQIDFASNPATSPVTLWGKGTLGSTAAETDYIRASKVSTSPSHGGYAWAVMDEGIKARVNTPYLDEATSVGKKTSQLGTGKNPNTEILTGLGNLKRDYFNQNSKEFASIEKGVTPLNFGLAAEKLASGMRELLKPLTHDLSVSSLGLFTDTAAGGFKEDFNLLTNTNQLPPAYAGKGIYQSLLQLNAKDAVSDPKWNTFLQYARLYSDKVVNSNGAPMVRSQVPAGWQASSGYDPTTGAPGIIQKQAPPGLILMPTIAKVQVVFSILARDVFTYGGKAGDVIPDDATQLHGPWGNNFRGSSYDYLLHLLYTPVITLHNPYNVAIEFTNMKVVFSNVPFAIQVVRNGVVQTTKLAPLDQMYYSNSEGGTLSKSFGMNLKTKTSSNTPGETTFRLLPGEVKMFSPYIDPSLSWQVECSSGDGARKFSDWDTGKFGSARTLALEGIPGWRGDGIGFDLDWLCPAPMRVSDNEVENGKTMNRGGCIGLRRDDELSFNFAPLSIAPSKNKFVVEMFASSGNSTNAISSGAIEMDYESPTGLQNFLLGGGTLRYPKSGTINTLSILDHSSTPIKSINKVKPFALLSARAKTTAGGLDPNSEDGRLATKPWSFAHAVIGAVSEKIVSEHTANHSHEIDLQLLENGTNNILQVDSQDRSNFISGNTGFNGVKFGGMYDIPLAPLQTLSSLNGANPGGASGYLPRFAQPIGNSWAHPLLAADKIIQANSTGSYLDHSFLLNTALYDHFYFSGFADQTGPFCTGKSASALAADFADGQPLDDPRMILSLPDGKSATNFTEQLKQTMPETHVAAWQMMRGAFNVNSTSVNAWKAMLGSIRDTQSVANVVSKADKVSKITPLKPSQKNQARISRFRLPGSDTENNGADPRDAYWLGPREYTDSQLQILAENIVKQVRLRGPFLSMSEFVNRRLGSGETAQRGALQQAIDDSNINQAATQSANAGYEIDPKTVADYKYQNPTAGSGSSSQGAPGFLCQADILNVLGNAATARSDTFTIRGYGEARDTNDKILASVTCEAIIQRLPDYIDSADKAETAPTELVSTANKTFGRRFNIVSFRWLSQNEI